MKKRVVMAILMLGMMTISISACKNKEQVNVNEESEKVEQAVVNNESEETEEVTQTIVNEESEEIEQAVVNNESEKTEEVTPTIENEEKQETDELVTREYILEEYGFFEKRDHEFINENDEVLYSYDMECFHFYNEPNLEKVILTMDNFYNEIEENYQIEGNMQMEADFIARCRAENGEIELNEEELKTGHDYANLVFLGIKYVGNDYISTLYNRVSYMGGVHPYSMFEGVTINFKTGKRLSISEMIEEVLKREEAEVLEEIRNKMGIEILNSDFEGIDYYLTDSSVVFFYQMPGYWENVEIRR